MTFAARMTRSPRPYNTEMAFDVRQHYLDCAVEIQDLVAGTGGCSPYLAGLLTKETDWIIAAFDDPEAAIARLFSELPEVAPTNLPSALRRAKRRVACLTALADLAGVWPLETVTQVLTDFADLSVHLALRATVGAEIRRGKLPGAVPEDAETGGGLVALAMGKMGAGELNYSSDIDLICLFDESRFDPDVFMDARASLIRATRKMSAMLNDKTAEGYVFRTDLRLRPDPSVTPVCLGMEAAERYYESLGRTWERAAFIKARSCAGDVKAGETFLQTLRPFIWRKHLDFAAIQDAHAMRLRIREHKGLGGPITLPKHHMKLGRGGIREIEFFTQTRQLIAGGRDPSLRMRGTVPGLAALAQKGWIEDAVSTTLATHYRFHREVEHRVQMINDAQTHLLPGSDEGFERLACFMDVDHAAFKRDISDRLEEVHSLTEDFFAPDAAAPTETFAFDHTVLSRWPTYPALRSDRASTIFARLKPTILERLSQSTKPQEALLAFDGFLAGLPAGVQLFSLFEANPQLIDLLLDVAGTSPDLARHLSQHASVFDAVLGGDFFSEWPGEDGLTAGLNHALHAQPDYERKLDTARYWQKEWHFRVGVHHLRGLIDAETSSRQYADIAAAVLRGLWPVVGDHFSVKYGPTPGVGAVVLGMGSLGAQRLNARSDLDLIVIYDAKGVEFSEGKRQLATRTYFARLTQAMVTAMSAPMAEGKLYEVDMRLRPSGSQGPVATSIASFKDYQTGSAWTWEHLALTRARPICGPQALQDDIESFRRNVISTDQNASKILQETAQMREKISAAKGQGGDWDVKLGAGRLQDIELFAQAATLLSGNRGRSVGDGIRAAIDCALIGASDADILTNTYSKMWTIQSVAKLLSDKPLEPEDIGLAGKSFLLRESKADDLEDLKTSLSDHSGAAANVINRVLLANSEG